MPSFDARDLLAFPGGDNTTDTVIGGIHFNLTALSHWNYTLFTNGTISNGSSCWLTFEPYTPDLVYPNGSWINATSCYSPIDPIGTRSGTGLGFAIAFSLLLIPTLLNLTRHGRLYLPREKRFYPIGRRWQWYWAIVVCAAAMISLFTGVDVDRYYLPELPLVLNTFFWFIMQMAAMALVWEGVRHWGSWMERQFIDPNPFVLRQDDKRGMFEFWLPLFFYLWLWLNFFLIVPRNWGVLELQRSTAQTAADAVPNATDNRFKTAPFCLFVCWCTICVSLWHSIRHYEPRNRGLFNRLIGFLGYMPFRFVLMLPLSIGLVGYQALAAFQFWLSPLNAHTNIVAMYVGGYMPSLLIVIIQNIAGFLRPNEDRALIRQRRRRNQQIDQELSIVHKPAWWRRVDGDFPGGSLRDRIMRNVREVGGGRPTARNVEVAAETRAREAGSEADPNVGGNIEMNEMRRTNSVASSIRTDGTAPPPPYTAYGGKSDRRRSERTRTMAAELLFPNSGERAPSPGGSAGERGRRAQVPDEGSRRPETSERSNSAASGSSTNVPPQQVRSMLDV